MKDALLIRAPAHHALRLARNASLAGAFRLVHFDNGPVEDTVQSGLFEECVHLFAGERPPVFEAALATARRLGVRKAIIMTPRYWYSEAVAEACRHEGVDTFWSEVSVGDRILLDRIGCQYTEDSELVRFADIVPVAPARPLGPTRFPQPPERDPAALREALTQGAERVVVVFGQVPWDHATGSIPGGMGYLDWLNALLSRNTDTLFLFKHHPVAPTPGLEEHGHVRPVDESIHALLGAFRCFAAFSSTVILEGAYGGRVFATGGRHFLDDPRLCLRVLRPEDGAGLHARLATARPDAAALWRRLGFISRAYLLPPESSHVLRRLTTTSEDFFTKFVDRR